MARYECTECKAAVEIDTRDLGPWAGRALLSPLRVICPACVVRLGIEVRADSGSQGWALVDGREFRDFDGCLVRSLNRDAQAIYFRDDKKRQQEPHPSTS